MRRIIFLIAIFLLTLSPLMGQNPPVALPEDGNWPTIVGDSIMLIGPKQEALTEEQRYFNPPYLMVYPGKEHLKNDMIRAALCDCDPTKPNRRIGVFSVAPDKQVSFSQGNLQYLPAANIWKFADTQYEYLGNANKYLKPTFRNWVDLFGWSADNTTAPFGVSTSTNAADYAGSFVDWGTNTICGDAPGTWRTLSRDEWEYLLNGRDNASQLRFRVQVNNVNGFVFLPDQWLCPEGIELNIEQLTTQVFTLDAWSKMENAGAVFLPAAGRLNDKQLVNFDDHGNYWSSTRIDNTNVDYFAFTFSTNKLHVDHQSPIHFARSVRLVHDTIVPIPEYVDLGLSVKWATFNVGASKPEDYGDYFAWGETEPKETYSWATYKWGTSSNLTKYNTTDGKTILDPEDDAAQVHWGDKWRMPSKEEVDELTQQCSWIWTTHNNVNGYKVTGPNGNSIFLPAAGYKGAGPTYPAGEDGLYWTNTTEKQHYSYLIVLHDDAPPTQAGRQGTRCFGFTIRPVYDDIPDPCLVVKVNDTLSINMMCVEGGTFTMGDDNTSNASPAHQVTLSDYYIGQTEVTQTLWKAVMGNVPTGNKTPSYPIGYVSYADCQDFIAKLNNLTGLHFQLPTEAEWEYAAMGGNKSHGYLYSGSNTIDDVAWYDQNSENKMHNVGAKQPNELGIYDMSGNAWEWCADYYDKYTADPKTDPKGPTTGTGRVIRSGSFRTTAERCSNKHRQAREADYPDSHITLRLVLHDTEPAPEPEYVDLGLSVKWATFNVGATSPEDYGDYFAWGETEPKETYSWATYKWGDGTDANITKYNATDGKTILEPADDAAQVHWGGKWRMPTKEEIEELIDNCTWSESIQNGVKGYVVTSKHTGNSIFFPYSGYFNHDNSATLQGEKTLFYTWSAEHSDNTRGYDIHNRAGAILLEQNTRRCGFPIRPVYDDRPTLTVIPTPEDAKVTFLCKGYQAVGHSITVDKGKDVLYQVTNVDAGYLSQGDSIYNLTKDSVLYVTLRPFSDGNWVKVDKSEYKKQEGYYVSRNNGGFASYSSWSYYVLPVLPGETYRVRGIAGQHAALWMAASTAPDPATNTRPTKISCCANRGVAAYVADEVTIPDGAKYLIINSRNGQEMMVERKVPDPCLVVKVNDTLSINLMCVEGGTFRMGVGADNYIERDDPQANKDSTTHLVTLSNYYMAETAVTQGLWKAVMGTDIRDMVAQSRYPDDTPKVGDRYPMGYVTLKDALAFVDELNKLTGLHFRLPTEAEREYAARGGKRSRNYKYPGSNDYSKVASPYGTPVAQKLPNELGIYDLSGGTREMCTDSWQTTYIYDEHVVNPVGPILSAGNRTMRGGHIHSQARPFTRYPFTPTWCRNELGFRIILPTETKRRMIHVNGSFFEMCFVEGGTFMMGSDAPSAEADEQPIHEVSLSDYYIGQTEVTQHLWQAVMGSGNNPSATKGNNLPVTNISWDEAQTFVERLSELTGMRFRLPTEAEWEYAARGGERSKGYTYAGSDNIDEVGWYAGNSGNKLHAVGGKLPNELGIFDMTGNAWEWCQDWYGAYQTEAQVNPTGPNFGSSRVLRSGSFTTTIERCTAKFRQARQANYPDTHIGLRIVLEPEKHYRYGFTQEDWDAATSSWGHQGRGHAPADQSYIQGTMVRGIRLKVARAGSLNVYKVPSLLEKTEDNFELVATLTTQTTGLQDFDFAEPIYIAPNEYLVFGKPSEEEPTLRPCWLSGNANGLPAKAKGVAHYIGTGKAEVAAPNGSLMVEFY